MDQSLLGFHSKGISAKDVEKKVLMTEFKFANLIMFHASSVVHIIFADDKYIEIHYQPSKIRQDVFVSRVSINSLQVWFTYFGLIINGDKCRFMIFLPYFWALVPSGIMIKIGVELSRPANIFINLGLCLNEPLF